MIFFNACINATWESICYCHYYSYSGLKKVVVDDDGDDDDEEVYISQKDKQKRKQQRETKQEEEEAKKERNRSAFSIWGQGILVYGL